MDRKELAVQLHAQGFNCAQAVACAFCNVMGYDPQTVFKLSEAFGGGMGTASTCGAISGMAMVIGMKTSDGDLDHPGTKKVCYDLMKEATARFLERVPSTLCCDIKDLDPGDGRRSCDCYIAYAAEILDDLLLGIRPDGVQDAPDAK